MVAFLRWTGLTVAALLLLAMLWVVWPARVNPQFWAEPAPPPLTGLLAPGAELAQAQSLCAALCPDPIEAVLPLDGGRILVGQDRGGLILLDRDTGRADRLMELGGGGVASIVRMPDGGIAVSTHDALHRVDLETRRSRVLSRGAPGRPFAFINAVAAAPDGRLFFTDSTTPRLGDNPARAAMDDMLENRPHGRVYVWSPESGRTTLLADRLYFPNGIALSSDGRSLLIAESWRYTIRRFWLSGPRAGGMEEFASNLPGLPDGLLTDGDGNVFVAMKTDRQPAMAWMHAHPWMVEMITKLPRVLWSGPTQTSHRGHILVMTEEGDIIDRLDAPDGRWGMLANLALDETGGLLFTSLDRPYFGRLPNYAPPADRREGAAGVPIAVSVPH